MREKSELLNSKNHLLRGLLLKKETIIQAHTQLVQDIKQNSGDYFFMVQKTQSNSEFDGLNLRNSSDQESNSRKYFAKFRCPNLCSIKHLKIMMRIRPIALNQIYQLSNE